MGRPTSLTDNAGQYNSTGVNTKWVQNLQYDVAGRMTSLQSFQYSSYGQNYYITETTGYNSNNQLTSRNWSYAGFSGGLQYSYPAQNNGQITQVFDTMASTSGETITYQYDVLKRLTSASSASSGIQTYQYDGFGNLTAKVLNGSTTAIAVNAATNQLSSSPYDLNGNMTSGVGASFTYDEANRMITSKPTSGGTEYYGYGPDNKRIYRLRADGTEEWTFYGAQGEKLMADMQLYGPQESFNSQGAPLNVWTYQFQGGRNFVWFGGKLINEGGGAVFSDRLGTNRASGARFYPYGDEIGGVNATANDRTKFGTYNRDGFTTLDYADQRFYASTYGNFTTPDPSMNNVDYLNPASWNAYSYTMGDPINGNDPSGLQTCGQTPIVGGVFNGQTVGQVLLGKSGNDLLATSIWLEGGTIYSSDLTSSASATAYATDLLGIGTAILNQLDVDDGKLTVYQNGKAVCPLGQCLGRNLAQVIIALEHDAAGAIFDSTGSLRNSILQNLENVLGTNVDSGPLVQDTSGNWVNQGCEGLFSSVAVSAGLLSGAYQRLQPDGLTLLFWNKASASSTTTFPGNAGYTGWRDDRSQGETFWGLSSTPPIRRPPPPRRRPL